MGWRASFPILESAEMPHRVVQNVEWAKPCERPGFIGRGRARGTKALGLSYEKKLATALSRAHGPHYHGQWYHYFADGKNGWCQPDFVLLSSLRIVVVECKLTNIEEATEQLDELYFPVLRAAYRLPVCGIIVVKSLTRLPPVATVCSTLTGALNEAHRCVPVLHWIGQGPI